MKSISDAVGQYYDRNTRLFLRHGQGGTEGAIHRAVWGEGVRSREEAFHHVHELLLQTLDLPESASPRILDLGCGVGASLFYLLARREATAYGVSNSAVQVALARGSVPRALASRVSFLEGNFCRLALPDKIDLAYGIESFVHSADAAAFFRNVSGALVAGGRLVLCDDFLTAEADTGAAEKWLREFRSGWRLSSLARPEQVDEVARRHGLNLLEDRDLTTRLELDRPRDRAIRLLVALGRPLKLKGLRWMNFLGGNALRHCLQKGWVTYRYRVFTKDRPDRRVSLSDDL